MGKKRIDAALILWALPVLASAASVPFPRQEHSPVLLAIPTANVLMHGQYRLAGRFQYFNTSEIGGVDTTFQDSLAGPPSEVQNLNYSSELLVGIENRAEIGVQYGRELSFSIKALLVREDLIWPDLVFGARNLFASQEAGLYGVSDETTLKNLQSESYATVAKSFASRSRLHLGVSVLTHANKGLVSVNGGLEQDLGKGAWLGYEVFERFSDFHQVVTLQWRYRNLVGFSLAMTEFQSWIRQGGEWGFFLTPSNTLSNGYNSPGISFSLQVLGWVPHREKRTLPERVAILEVKNAELEKQLEDMNEIKRRLLEMEARGLAPAADSAPVGSAPAAQQPVDQAAQYLKAIAEKSGSDVADPREIRELMGKIVALGPEGAETVKQTALDTSAGALRVHALMVMAYSKDSAYIASLRALCMDADPRIRRESLVALVKLGNLGALEDAKRLLSDPDATVAMAAGEAYRQLKPDRAGSRPAPAVAPRKRVR
ncbi:MAG: HEAT repeat domain-containing protein [Fibrobacteria bacterium]